MRYSHRQISKALLTARRLLKREVRPVAKVAAALNPFMDCTEVEGLSGQLHEDTKSAIFAAMADAYRREGNLELAAKWYRRASVFSPGEHAPVYAHIVCQHQLAEFYDDALRTLQAYQSRWLAKPILKRFVLRLTARDFVRTQKHDLAFLREHVLPKAA